MPPGCLSMEPSVECPFCGLEVDDASTYCPECGTQLEEENLIKHDL